MSYGKLRRYAATVVAQAKGEGGQALGEYALVLSLIALVAVAALTAIGLALTGYYEAFVAAFP
jgi:Flp pilus assembly pilin Flp